MTDHPRIRGEHRRRPVADLPRGGSSPHTRGARHPGEVRPKRPGIIPAYAGSTRAWRRSGTWRRDHPRIRGEHAQASHPRFWRRGSSPHTRGARPGLRCSSRRARIIPAYAGSTTLSCARRSGIRDHPRIRGEHALASALAASERGSSPHTRGAQPTWHESVRAGRIIPAYAGSTPTSLQCFFDWWDHPRIRGEHALDVVCGPSVVGSSPHTRGALEVFVGALRHHGIIPAYAGSTVSRGLSGSIRRDHPRIRGEHMNDDVRFNVDGGSSPHTRGARTTNAPYHRRGRIIPAYAGSTTYCTCRGRARTDHPRIRGEHFSFRIGPGLFPGSSPHTRGAL